tara:strand:+ start:2716 stop:3561 length:846 start_codon:yes stop_codon:yes gene_type:complete
MNAKKDINLDKKTVEGFGEEWTKFDQSNLDPEERENIFNQYFSIFPWERISDSSEGFDLGCGSGRWAISVASRVGSLHCIDPSNALEIAKRNLSNLDNCVFHKDSVDSLSLSDNSMDFGYSLGVLHHIPDTQDGINKCVAKLKPNAPFLVYLYYNFDNRPFWFKLLWSISDILRKVISRLPFKMKSLVCNSIALFIYYPLSRFSYLLSQLSINTHSFPLSEYKDKSFYTMQTDALDRFGTQLEKRYSKKDIEEMLIKAGLEKIVFRDSAPFWCALGYKIGR